MRSWRRRAGLFSAGCFLLIAGCDPARACADWNPLAVERSPTRPIEAEDLIELVGIGRPDAEPVGGDSPLGISPDGRWAALVIARGDAEANRYCQALILVDLVGGDRPRLLDRGGEFRMTRVAARGLQVANGYPRQTIPAFSPDGRSIAYLRRDRGRTRLWRIDLGEATARPISDEQADVSAFTWLPDGRQLGIAVEAERAAHSSRIAAEGLEGWRYDERIMPTYGFAPQPPADRQPVYRLIDAGSGHSRRASPGEAARIETALGDPAPDGRAGPLSARLIPTSASPLAPSRLAVSDDMGRNWECSADACKGRFAGMWWLEDGRTLVFLKREGWNNRHTALYRWSGPSAAPQRIVVTDGWIERCAAHGTGLLCIRESAASPPRLVRFSSTTGEARTVFDPNPGFDALTLGPVRRLTWRNHLGLEVHGDLVLPPGYEGNAKLPTIIVLYHSRGLLRGGTGNEYPIYLFARRGFAVLSIERPRNSAESSADIDSFEDVNAANLRGWRERRSLHSAITGGIELLVARGIADPGRLGITGLSDGATAVRYALINDPRFRAAAISSCCVDERTPVLGGPAWAAYSESIGYPPLLPLDRSFWAPVSLSLNAPAVRTPLLMQLADNEALLALPSVTALRHYQQPVELRIFPGEHHLKWQPAHRRAIYVRALDWFDFWLNGRIDPAPGKAAQYRDWRRLDDDCRASHAAARAHQDRAHASTSAKCMIRP